MKLNNYKSIKMSIFFLRRLFYEKSIYHSCDKFSVKYRKLVTSLILSIFTCAKFQKLKSKIDCKNDYRRIIKVFIILEGSSQVRGPLSQRPTRRKGNFSLWGFPPVSPIRETHTTQCRLKHLVYQQK